MQTPTTTQLRIAIKVLKELGERINDGAANSARELPDTQFGGDSAARLETRNLEQTRRTQAGTAHSKARREELVRERRQCVNYHV